LTIDVKCPNIEKFEALITSDLDQSLLRLQGHRTLWLQLQRPQWLLLEPPLVFTM
jgi:hypothetical protein